MSARRPIWGVGLAWLRGITVGGEGEQARRKGRVAC